jgi:hypothetical protein
MLEGLKAPAKDKLCALASKRLDLSDSDQEMLDSALADHTWATHSLHFALKELGFHISKDLIGFHRKRVCKCYKI